MQNQMPNRPQSPNGAPVKTLEMQEQERAQQQAAYQAYLQQQAQAQQAQPAPQAQPVGNPGQAFPGTAPGAPSNGLLGDTMDAIGNFFSPRTAENNPLMHEKGVGVGGEARRRRLEEIERQATGG